MAEFFNAVSAVLVIFLILSVGWVLGRLGWLTASEKSFISKYVVNIAVPINCIVGVLDNFSRDDLFAAGVQFFAGLIVVALSLLISAAVATALKLPRNRWMPYIKRNC